MARLCSCGIFLISPFYWAAAVQWIAALKQSRNTLQGPFYTAKHKSKKSERAKNKHICISECKRCKFEHHSK